MRAIKWTALAAALVVSGLATALADNSPINNPFPVQKIGGTYDAVTYCGVKMGVTGIDQAPAINACATSLATLFNGGTISFPSGEVDIGTTIDSQNSNILFSGTVGGRQLTTDSNTWAADNQPATRFKWIGADCSIDPTSQIMWLHSPSDAAKRNHGGGGVSGIFFDSGHNPANHASGACVELEISSWQSASFSDLFFYEPNGSSANGGGLVLNGVQTAQSTNATRLNFFRNIGCWESSTVGNSATGNDCIAIDKPNTGHAYWAHGANTGDQVFSNYFFNVYSNGLLNGDLVNCYAADHNHFFGLYTFAAGTGLAFDAHGGGGANTACRTTDIHDIAGGPTSVRNDTASFTGDLTSGSPIIANVSSVANIVIGMALTDSTTGGNIPGSTKVSSFTASTITMSANAGGNGPGDTIAGAISNPSTGMVFDNIDALDGTTITVDSGASAHCGFADNSAFASSCGDPIPYVPLANSVVASNVACWNGTDFSLKDCGSPIIETKSGDLVATMVANTTYFFGFTLPQTTLNTANEAQIQALAPMAGTLKNFSCKPAVAPGAGNSLTFNMRIGAANGNETVTVSDTSTALQTDSTHTDAVSVGSLLNFAVTLSATATNPTRVYCGVQLTHP